MDDRLKLQLILESIDPKAKVYYQPPSSLSIVYPCMIYKDAPSHINRASDGLYRYVRCYELSYISKSPNMEISKEILSRFNYSKMNSSYVSDGLIHSIFTIYY